MSAFDAGIDAVSAIATTNTPGFDESRLNWGARTNNIPLPTTYNPEYVKKLASYRAAMNALPQKGALFQYKIVEKLGKKVSYITMDDQWERMDGEVGSGGADTSRLTANASFCRSHYGAAQLDALYE